MAAIKPPYVYIGGKRRLIKTIKDNIPQEFGNYYEPFLGAGAVALYVMNNYPNRQYHIADYNVQVPITWQVIKDNPDELIEQLEQHAYRNDEYYFKAQRNLDKYYVTLQQTLTEIASRFIYICHTSWGGGYTVDKNNHCNKSFGKPDWTPDYKNIRELSALLNDRDVHIYSGDFETTSFSMMTGDLLYMDPPYDVVEGSAGNDNYVKAEDTNAITVRVRDLMAQADERGVYALASNSSTANTEELWRGWHSIETKVVWTSGAARQEQVDKLWGNFALERILTTNPEDLPKLPQLNPAEINKVKAARDTSERTPKDDRQQALDTE